MPFAVEPRNYKPGDVVRRMYSGHDKSPYTGVVVRVDTAANKVDVEWPMGVEREEPEFLLRETSFIKPPEVEMSKEVAEDVEKRIEARVLKKAVLSRKEIEESVKTLLIAGYSDEDAIKLLTDGYQEKVGSVSGLRTILYAVRKDPEIRVMRNHLRSL